MTRDHVLLTRKHAMIFSTVDIKAVKYSVLSYLMAKRSVLGVLNHKKGVLSHHVGVFHLFHILQVFYVLHFLPTYSIYSNLGWQDGSICRALPATNTSLLCFGSLLWDTLHGDKN